MLSFCLSRHTNVSKKILQMNKLFLDIETLPAEQEKHEVLKEIHQKKTDDGKKVRSFEDFITQTSFDGAFGRIACISYAVNDEATKSLFGDEKQILEIFWDVAKNVDIFVGFNVMDFDLRFIYQRSMILGAKPTKDLSFARYRKSPIYDVMREWVKWNMQAYITLDVLAKALGIPSSKGGDVEGKNVARAFEDGRIREICEYCEKDVDVTRKIYKKMTFEEPGSKTDDIPF